MRRAGGTCRRPVHAARLCLRPRCELAQVRRRNRGMHDDDRRRHRDHSDRDEVFVLVRHVLAHEAVGDRARSPDEEGITVGFRLCHVLGADDRAGARLVLDHHGLSYALGDAFGRRARDEVVRTAGRERHDPAYRPVGPVGEDKLRKPREDGEERRGKLLSHRNFAESFSSSRASTMASRPTAVNVVPHSM